MSRIILTLYLVIFTLGWQSNANAESRKIVIPSNILRGVMDPQGPLVYLLLGDSSLCVVNIESGVIEQWLPLSHAPGAMAMTPNGEKLYVGSFQLNWNGLEESGQVTEFRLSDLSQRTTELPLDVGGLAATDSGLLVVAAGPSGGNVLSEFAVFRTDTWQKVSSRSNVVGGLKLALHPSQEIVYAADTYWSPSEIHHFKLSNTGNVIDKWDSPYHMEYWFGTEVFLSRDGAHLVSGSGVMLTCSPDQENDLRFIRKFEVERITGATFDTNRNTLIYSDGRSVTHFDLTRNEVIGVTTGETVLGLYEEQIVALSGSSVVLLRRPAETAEENVPPRVSLQGSSWEVLAVGTEASFAISATDEDSGIQTVRLFRGMEEVASSTNSFSALKAEILPGTNDFYVVATDYFGASGTSGVVRIYGNTRPTVRIVEPEANFTSNALPTEITVLVEAEDVDGGVTNVILSVNGRIHGSDSTAPYEFVIRPVDYGSYIIVATAADNLGEIGSSEERRLQFPGGADEFGPHLIVRGGTNLTYRGSTFKATSQKGEPVHAGVAGGKSIWWAYRPPGSGVMVVDTFGSDFDTVLAVYSGGPEGPRDITKLVPVVANDDDVTRGPASSVKFFTPGNQIYYIAVDGHEGVSGNVVLNINLSGSPLTPVLNDHLASAAQIGTSDRRSSVGATKEPGEPPHAGNAGGASLWWRYRPTSRGTVRVTAAVETRFDTLLAVYTTNAPTAGGGPPTMERLQLIAANDDRSATDRRSELTFIGDPTRFYYIAVDGYNGASGWIFLSVSTITESQGGNAFSSAIGLSGTSVLTSGVNLTATMEPGEPMHAGETNSGSIWYRWTAPANGLVSISTRLSEFDTVLAVYSGSNLTNLTLVAANDDDPANRPTSAVIFHASAGTEYRIAVAGYGSARGKYVLAINSAPTFQPRLISQWLNGRLWLEVRNADDLVTLESSTDLMNWEAIDVWEPGESAIEVATEGGAPMRFYRVRHGSQ